MPNSAHLFFMFSLKKLAESQCSCSNKKPAKSSQPVRKKYLAYKFVRYVFLLVR